MFVLFIYNNITLREACQLINIDVMKKIFTNLFITVVLLSACSSTSYQESIKYTEKKNVIYTAYKYIDLHERLDRNQIKSLIGIDPVRTEWCAAFVNSVLHRNDIPGSESVSEHPLLAKSFLTWGQEVYFPQPGDVVVFHRGNQAWQGHVGFYVNSYYSNGIEYYLILGGNQDNRVAIDSYPAHRALSIRRSIEYYS